MATRKSVVRKAVARQYLRPGNHARSKNLCSTEGCNARPINRVYFNTGKASTEVQLLCPVHVLDHLSAPTNADHVKHIRHDYRRNANWVVEYSAE